MKTDGKNPCDICKLDCFMKSVECPLVNHFGNTRCNNEKCMLHYEGSCILGIQCGASGYLKEEEEEQEDE